MCYNHLRHLQYDMTVTGCIWCEQLKSFKAKRREETVRKQVETYQFIYETRNHA